MGERWRAICSMLTFSLSTRRTVRERSSQVCVGQSTRRGLSTRSRRANAVGFAISRLSFNRNGRHTSGRLPAAPPCRGSTRRLRRSVLRSGRSLRWGKGAAHPQFSLHSHTHVPTRAKSGKEQSRENEAGPPCRPPSIFIFIFPSPKGHLGGQQSGKVPLHARKFHKDLNLQSVSFLEFPIGFPPFFLTFPLRTCGNFCKSKQIDGNRPAFSPDPI